MSARVATAALVLAFAAGGAAPASPLGPPPPSGTGLAAGQCLLTHEMGRHAVVDQNTLLVDGFGRSRGVYRFTMSNGCLRSVISSDRIGVLQSGRGKICKPSDAVLTGRGGPCAIDSIVKLSAEEVETLPRGVRP